MRRMGLGIGIVVTAAALAPTTSARPCNCSGGMDFWGYPVHPTITRCGFEVCADDGLVNECTTEGWTPDASRPCGAPARGGRIVWVDDLNDGQVGSGTSADPFRDLQDAIDAASDGDTLRIRDGLYPGRVSDYVDPTCGNCEESPFGADIPVTTGFYVAGKSLRLVGESMDGTILSTGANYGVLFENAGTSTIQSLTITGGDRKDDRDSTDAALLARYTHLIARQLHVRDNTDVIQNDDVGILGIAGREGATLTVTDSLIENNSWDGIALYRGDAAGNVAVGQFLDNVIRHGPRTRGVAIGLTWDSKGTLVGNEIYDWVKGIGVLGDAVEALVANNVLHTIHWWGIATSGTAPKLTAIHNVVDGASGPAVWSLNLPDGEVTLVNNVLSNSGVGVQWHFERPDAAHNDLWNNGTDLCEGDCRPIEVPIDNLSVEPRFVDAASHDYRLACDSPLIDAGHPRYVDLDGTRSDVGLQGGPLGDGGTPVCGVELCNAEDDDDDGFVDENGVCACRQEFHEGHDYLFCDTHVDWETARRVCATRGGMDLVVIDDSVENEFIVGAGAALDRWIGLSDADDEGSWRWVDGTDPGYTRWGEFEPNGGTQENCGSIWLSPGSLASEWNDLSCTWERAFICEDFEVLP